MPQTSAPHEYKIWGRFKAWGAPAGQQLSFFTRPELLVRITRKRNGEKEVKPVVSNRFYNRDMEKSDRRTAAQLPNSRQAYIFVMALAA